MEIEGEDGSKIEVGSGSKAVFGRGCGFNTKDRTVSRHHVIFQLDNQTVSFQVAGKNPVWVRSGEEVKIFRRSEKGVVAAGDWLCISSQNPVWFRLKGGIGGRIGVLESDSGDWDAERFGISNIDPVKEFGFLVIGHEFDCYPKERIKDPRSWDWFIEEPEQDSESFERKKKCGMGKRKKKVGGNDDDDDWRCGNEDGRETVGKIRKVERPKYSTRSKERNKPRQDPKRKEVSARKRNEEDNEDDETLGGFIVDDEEGEEQGEEGDDEEEFIDDDEELDD